MTLNWTSEAPEQAGYWLWRLVDYPNECQPFRIVRGDGPATVQELSPTRLGRERGNWPLSTWQTGVFHLNPVLCQYAYLPDVMDTDGALRARDEYKASRKV